MRFMLALVVCAALALSSTTRAQSFTVTPYGPTCGPIATGTVTPQGNTNRFRFTVTNCAPNEFVFHIVGVNEIAYPINIGMNCLILTELAFVQSSRTDPTGTNVWSHSLSAQFCGFARIQFAEITFDAQNNPLIRMSNGLFMNCN